MTTITTAPTFMSRDIPVAHIDPDPHQPRTHFDPTAVAELAQSMQAAGLAAPILVRPTGERFTIVHGERRWRAACSLGWDTIPAIVRDLDPDAAHWLALIENIQRADLTPMEEAEAYQSRLAVGMTQEELGRRIGKSQSAIAQKLRLLTLPEPLALFVRRGALTEGHARQLLRLRGWFHGLADPRVSARDGDADTVTAFDAKILAITTSICLRPEDNPPAALIPADDAERDLFNDACRAIFAYLTATGEPPLLWVSHAFWWAMFAAHFGVSVADVSTALDLWHDRFLSSVAWAILYGKPNPPAGDSRWGELERSAWYGYRSDLRHAGVWPYIKAGTLPRALHEEAIDSIVRAEGLLFPSVMQPWGFKAAEGRELRARETGATDADIAEMDAEVAS